MLTLMRALADMARASLPSHCRHRGEHVFWDEHDGTSIEACCACGTRWVTFCRGTRVRVPAAR